MIHLRKERIEQEDYYKELLEMQSCGVLAYTIPGHKIIHMNAQALRMYGVENIEEAQSKTRYYAEKSNLSGCGRNREVEKTSQSR